MFFGMLVVIGDDDGYYQLEKAKGLFCLSYWRPSFLGGQSEKNGLLKVDLKV